MPAVAENPLIADNCPDPAVVRIDDGGTAVYYLVCTSNRNGPGGKFPLRRSTDLVHWERSGDLFPAGHWPSWAREDFWAPEIHPLGQRYVAYYTARDAGGRLCIGAAFADRAQGPWTDLGRPFLRDERVGLIDAHLFLDEDGRRYLYWKEDGNALDPPAPTPIHGREIAPDGLTFVGERVPLIRNDRPWEGDLVEGPWVERRDGRYYLFFSGNAFNSARYATGVARAAAPLGPFEKLPDPILRSNDVWWGPGHGSVVEADGTDFFVYHAWESGRVDEVWNQSVHPRMALIDPIEWDGGWPRIHDGTPSTERPS